MKKYTMKIDKRLVQKMIAKHIDEHIRAGFKVYGIEGMEQKIKELMQGKMRELMLQRYRRLLHEKRA